MTTVFRKSDIDKDKLRLIIKKNPQALFEGLSFIDFQLGTEEDGIIEFLGVDKNRRLTVINFDAEVNNDLLISSLSQIQWLKKNKRLIERLFFSENIDHNIDLQIFLIAPGFSVKLKEALKQIGSVDIRLIEFQYVIADDTEAIIFENVSNLKSIVIDEPLSVEKKAVLNERIVPLENNEAAEEIKEENPELIPIEVVLTPEEIATFMDFDKTLIKKKISV